MIIRMASNDLRAQAARRAGAPLLAALLVLQGCAAVPARPAAVPTAMDEIVAELDDAVADSQQSSAARQAESARLESLLPPLTLDATDPALDERFDVSVTDVAASTFFQSLVQDTDLNMVVHPDVTGSVSLQLRQVTVGEVMSVMRDVYGYDFERDGRMFHVYPDTLRTEVFQLDYLNLVRDGSSEMLVSGGRLTDVGSTGQSQTTDQGTMIQSGSGGQGVAGSRINTRSSADFWTELEATLTLLVGDGEGRRVIVTPQVGIVVVRAEPASINAVRSYLQRAQLTLERQVVLEAKILEVTLSEGFESGVDWHTFGDESGGTFRPVTGLDALGNEVVTNGSDNRVAAEIFGAGGNLITDPFSAGFSFFFGFDDFEGVVSLLESQGTVQTLSSPRIATVNNQKAVIKVGSDEFFVTNITTTTITAGASINQNDSPELTPFFSGIALDVTPQIGEDNDVILHIHPSVTEVTEQRKEIAGRTVPLAASTIRESDSIVRARSGQVIVIGGLMQNTRRENDSGLPGLRRVPLLGRLAGQRESLEIKRELVIVLRPIVVDPQAQEKQLRRSLERFRALAAQRQPLTVLERN